MPCCLLIVIRVRPCPLCQVKHLSALIPTINEYLLDYNAESKTPMGLVMFMDAVEHVSRISRILRQVRCGVHPKHQWGCHGMCTPQPLFFSRTAHSFVLLRVQTRCAQLLESKLRLCLALRFARHS